MTHPMYQSFVDELQKIAQTKTEKRLDMLPGIGATVGGVAGAIRPSLGKGVSKALGAGAFGIKGRVAGALGGATTGAAIAWLPQVFHKTYTGFKSAKNTKTTRNGKRGVGYSRGAYAGSGR